MKCADDWSRFPRSRFADSNSLVRQLCHITSELCEVWVAFLLLPWRRGNGIYLLVGELMDVIHSVETALHILAKRYDSKVVISQTMVRTIEKNLVRGYYGSVTEKENRP